MQPELPSKQKKKRRILQLLVAVAALGVGLALLELLPKTVQLKDKSVKSSNEVNYKLSEKVPQPLETFGKYGLTIEKLNISAPIIPQVDGYNSKLYYAALKKGVAQFKGSADPDKPGNLFIFGHSSFFKGVKGDYKEVFKELDKLKADDEFVVYYQDVPYRYKVVKSYETNDKDWSLIDPTPQDKGDKTATLMTCYPPGTTKKRWAVVGEQI